MRNVFKKFKTDWKGKICRTEKEEDKTEGRSSFMIKKMAVMRQDQGLVINIIEDA